MTAPHSVSPFDTTGVVRGADGIARYTGLAPSLVHMLQASVDAWPDEEAVVEIGGERLTYAQLWERSAVVAGGLRAAGVRRGDRVAVNLPNGVPWALAFWGTLLAGGVAVPINTRFTESEAAYVVADCGAIVVLDTAVLPTAEPFVDDGVVGSDLCSLFYTSGTTGRPKGAMTTHEALVAIAETTRRLRLTPDEPGVGHRNLVSVPLFHVTGCNSQFISMLAVGACAVLMPTFHVTAFLDALESERITMSTSVPAIYWLALNRPELADKDLSALRMVSYGGAPIAPELVARLRDALPRARLGNGYGMSEAGSVATYLPHEWADRRPESVGFAIPVVDLKLDPEPDPSEQRPVGELLMRGQTITLGYWGDPDRTAEAITDGWLHSGDIASIDQHGPDAGLVCILDRAKDMVSRGGENVYCVEVESALVEHPMVGEVAIVAIPDEVMGERVGAVLVPAAEPFDLDMVLTHARTVLADFKVPEWVRLRGEPLPRNAGGKVLKTALRDDGGWQRVARPLR